MPEDVCRLVFVNGFLRCYLLSFSVVSLTPAGFMTYAALIESFSARDLD